MIMKKIIYNDLIEIRKKIMSEFGETHLPIEQRDTYDKAIVHFMTELIAMSKDNERSMSIMIVKQIIAIIDENKKLKARNASLESLVNNCNTEMNTLKKMSYSQRKEFLNTEKNKKIHDEYTCVCSKLHQLKVNFDNIQNKYYVLLNHTKL